MTASLVGQVGPGQRPASRRRRESSEGRLGPLLNQQPTATIPPNPPPTSAVRGWPHWWCVSQIVSVWFDRIPPMRKPVAALEISAGQRELLESVARSQSGAHREVVRAKALLMASQGVANSAIAQALSVSAASVANWRARFAEDGMARLGQVRKGRGRKPSIPQETIEEILDLTQNYRPQGQSHWSCRTMAEAVGVSKDTVQRVWSARGLKPHRVETFKLSNDPRFDEKLVDVVGLYLNPRAPRGADDLSGGERPSPPGLSQQGR